MKRQRVVDALRQEITTGRLAPGARLPGEHDLAERFSVSRGTVRAALAELADEEYIATRGGIGSIVTFDGTALDPRAGWARSIHAAGASVTVQVLNISVLDDDPVAREAGFTGALVAVDRLRHAGGTAISLERSRIPYLGTLRDVVTRGLVDDSITATLDAAGLVPARAEQWVGVIPLAPDDASLLGQEPGTPFLHSRRVSRTHAGEFVESVDSLLAPDRFRLHMRFGSTQ
ncbi:GntR family transcriptional regulator [Kineosporia succinea]